MNSDHVIGELLGYLEGILPETERVRVEQHLGECQACYTEYITLAETHRALGSTLRGAASRAAAPPDAWARLSTRFEGRLKQTNSPRQARGRTRPMTTKKQSSQGMPALSILFAGGAAALLLIIAVIVYVLLSNGKPQIAISPSATPTPGPGNPTLSAEEIAGTQRPQSGGGSGDPDGTNGENLAPTWQGTVRAVDPTARTITLEPDGQVVRVMDFTEFIIEDITWIGAKGSFDDIRPGMLIQADLFSDNPAFARIIWVKRTQAQFWEDGAHELYSGEITSLDASTGVFSLEPQAAGQFQVTGDTRILIDTDAVDGQPATQADVQIGQVVNIVSPMGASEPRPVNLLIIVPPDPRGSWEWHWATVKEVGANTISVQITDSIEPTVIEIGPEGYAQSQGVAFAAGDLIAFQAARDGAQLTPIDIVKLATGEWLRLRDVNGPLWLAP